MRIRIRPGMLLAVLAAALLSPAAPRGEVQDPESRLLRYKPWPADAELSDAARAEGRRHEALLSPAGVEPVFRKRPELFQKAVWRNADERTRKQFVRVEDLAESDERFLAAWWGVEDGRFVLRVSSGLLRFLSEVAKSYELARVSEEPAGRPREASFHLYYEYLSYVGGRHYVWHPIPAFEALVGIPFPPVAASGKKDPARDLPAELTRELLEFLGSALRRPEVSDLITRAVREKGFVDAQEFKDKVAALGFQPHVAEKLRLLAVAEAIPRSLSEEPQRADFNAMMRTVLRVPEMAELIAGSLADRGVPKGAAFEQRVLALPETREVRERFSAMVRAEEFPVLFFSWLSDLQKAIRDTNRRLVSAMVAHEVGHLALGYPQALLSRGGMLLGGHDDAQVASTLLQIEYGDADERKVDAWFVESLSATDPPGFGLVLLLDALSGVGRRMLGTNFRYVFLHPVEGERIPVLVNLYFKKGQDMAKLRPFADRVVDGYVTRAADLRRWEKPPAARRQPVR